MCWVLTKTQMICPYNRNTITIQIKYYNRSTNLRYRKRNVRAKHACLLQNREQKHSKNVGLSWLNAKHFWYGIYQCFPTFFGSGHPNLVLKIFGGTPSWFNRYKDQGIVTIGGTPGTSSWHPCVPRHPGSESLAYTNQILFHMLCEFRKIF